MRGMREGGLTLPAIVNDDWATSASGAAGMLFAPLMALDPAPPVTVTVPSDRVPSAAIGIETTALFASLVRK